MIVKWAAAMLSADITGYQKGKAGYIQYIQEILSDIKSNNSLYYNGVFILKYCSLGTERIFILIAVTTLLKIDVTLFGKTCQIVPEKKVEVIKYELGHRNANSINGTWTKDGMPRKLSNAFSYDCFLNENVVKNIVILFIVVIVWFPCFGNF